MRKHTKRLYVTPETHAVIVTFCKERGLEIQFFTQQAIEEAIAARSIARRFDRDSQQFINYVVEYPQGEQVTE